MKNIIKGLFTEKSAKIAVGTLGISIVAAGSTFAATEAIANINSSKTDFCVTAYWESDSSIRAQAGSCDNSIHPGPGGETGGEEDGESVTYNGETIVGWASNDLSTVKSDEKDFNVKNGMLSTYTDFVNNKDFPKDFVNAAKDRDAALLIAWEPWNWDNGIDQPDFKPTKITAGDYDTHITEWLTEAQSATKDAAILVRFAPEMNDAVRPWSFGVNGGNTADEYIEMWKHVYQIKESVAPDVEFMWTPLVAGSDGKGNSTEISDFYPGTEYVDMLALDGFNWGDVQNSSTCGWQSYEDVFKAPVNEIKSLSGGKPWGIAEVASVSMGEENFQPGGKCNDAWGWVYDWPESGEFYKTPQDWITQAGWTKAMINNAHKDGALFVNMFNAQKETDWRLNSTDEGKKVLTQLKENVGIKAGEDNSSDLINSALGK